MKIQSFFKIPRLFCNFHFWTFFLSIFRKSKILLEKKIIKKLKKNCDGKNSYGLKQKINIQKMLLKNFIYFIIFFGNNLGTFSIDNICQ